MGAGRTMCLAGQSCAHTEVQTHAKRRAGRRDPLTQYAAEAGVSFRDFITPVGAKWAERQHMGVGHPQSSRRTDRLTDPRDRHHQLLARPGTGRAEETAGPPRSALQ
jgi:hypothetical protein